MSRTATKSKDVLTSQCRKIRRHLEAGRTITPIQALNKFGCFRLSGRIYDLINDEQLPIVSTMVKDPKSGKRFARYSLPKHQ